MSQRSKCLCKGPWWFSFRTILIALVLALIGSCAPIRPTAPLAHYYVNSEIVYLRDGPRYEGRVLGQLYKGDQVETLESYGLEWWRVRSGRTGQEGWVQEGLISLNPVPINYFYVSPDTVALRECPGEECPSLQLLYRGDEVQPVEKNTRGWWRVLVVKGRGLGWVPEKALVEDLPLQPKVAAQAYYYVAVNRLKLYQQPLHLAQVVKTLKINDQLQKLAETPLGWFKVRQPSSGAVGWVESRYLESLPLQFPRQPKSPKKKAPPAPLPEPEVM
ncbi:MAG: SH3 domain-containing protein [Thermodesulfobacteriota bacterium]